MSKYKLIQLTNTNIGELAVDSYIPFGITTRRLNSPCDNCSTFQVASSNADIIYINEPGYYKVTYNASFIGSGAGDMAINLITNQTTTYTVTSAVAAADDPINMNLVYVIRVCPNCCSAPNNCPVSVQLQLTGLATAAGPSTGNLIIEKVY
jgi:hypothetical protein